MSGLKSFSTVNDGKLGILCVEDDFGIQAVLKACLSKDPQISQAWIVACGDEALDAIEDLVGDQNCLPDLLVLDHNLASETGAEVAASIRQLHGNTMPVILCSACDTSASDKLAEECGAVAFLAKPYQPAELLRLIHLHAAAGVSPPPAAAQQQ